MSLRRLEEVPVTAKRVFIRADLNVPIRDGEITDSTRVDEALPAIKWVIANGGHPIVASHLGRPKAKRVQALTLRPGAQYLGDVLHVNVLLAEDCVGEKTLAQSRALGPREVLLLENLRFHAGEEANDERFARELAALADVYVNDAFGTAHRAHASTVGMVPFVAARAIGPLMRREVENLSPLLGEPARPFVIVLGGAKVADKIGLVRHLVDRIDALLIGGATAYTFLRAQGVGVGDSLVAEDEIPVAHEILDLAAKRDLALLLPTDHVAVQQIAPEAPSQITSPGVPGAWKGVDIGPVTTRRFADKIVHAKTIFWNGPLGIFETKPFDRGTVAIATEIGRSGAFSIVGGGDSVAALVQSGHADEISHISTGGGAALEFLEGRKLPGLAALEA